MCVCVCVCVCAKRNSEQRRSVITFDKRSNNDVRGMLEVEGNRNIQEKQEEKQEKTRNKERN